MDWPNFFLGIFYSLLPKNYWRSWRPSSTVDFARSAIASGVIECVGFLYLLIHGYFHFLVVRTHQLQGVENTNEGTQLYVLVLLSIEYVFHPLSLICMGLMADGALRAWAAFLSDEILPSIPVRLVAWVQAWQQARQQKKTMGPEIPDLFERVREQDYDARICSQRPKDGWRISGTICVEAEFHEIVRVETGTTPRPFVYLLRKLPAGRVIRGMNRYDPPGDSGGS